VVWAHCQSKEVLDDARCPTCGMSKAEWTVHVDSTRVFKVSVGKAGRAKPQAWLEVALVEVDGQPVRGKVPAIVDLPNGRRVAHTLVDGLLRLEELPAGACRVALTGYRPGSDPGGPARGPDGELFVMRDRSQTEPTFVSCATGARLTLRRTHWIEVTARAADGAPLADERYILEFRDATQGRVGRLDASGVLYIDGFIHAGPCELTFPDRVEGDVLLTVSP
jgi:hypothetical protein